MTWERQRRNESLSRALNADLIEIIVPGDRLKRYLVSLLATLRVFRKTRPSLIFAQNPSMVLAAFAVFYGRLTRVRVVIDAHYAGVRPLGGRASWANRVTRFIARYAYAVIVTNGGDAAYIQSLGGRPFILPDPMPVFPPVKPVALAGRHNILFVCTWAADEPYAEVIDAAKRLPEGACVYITGNPKGRDQPLHPLPPNVILTGYVSDADYLSMLGACDVVVDLTTREDCLVCGAYEAIAMGKPLVTSATRVLQAYFGRAAVYTDNSADDLALKLREALEAASSLGRAGRQVHQLRQEEWALSKQRFERLLADGQLDSA